jgi:hypothetical protein
VEGLGFRARETACGATPRTAPRSEARAERRRIAAGAQLPTRFWSSEFQPRNTARPAVALPAVYCR